MVVCAVGLSAAQYNQMMNFLNPRVFGVFGSASALGSVSIYFVFSWWHAITVRKWRIVSFIVAAVYLSILVFSAQCTALI